MKFIEHCGMKTVHIGKLAVTCQHFFSVIQSTVQARQRVPDRRNTNKAGIGRNALCPLVDLGFETVAMRTAVPEYFGNLDLIGTPDRRLCRNETMIVLPL
jgi:hypothetical protein